MGVKHVMDAFTLLSSALDEHGTPLAVVLLDVRAAVNRIAVATERQAAAAERFNRIMELANDIDPDAAMHADPPLKKGEPDPHQPWTDEQEEAYASIEILEEAGVKVPADAYKRLGLDPPEREDEPTADELEAEQPGADAGASASNDDDDAEPIAATRER